MDDTSNRLSQLNRHQLQKTVKNVRHHLKQSIAKNGVFFRMQKQTLLAIALLACIILLLFGISSQLQAPSTDTTPSGVTSLNYSTFEEQVKAGNVLAIVFQAANVYALSASPLGKERTSIGTPTASTPDERAAEIAAWTRSVDPAYSNWLVPLLQPPAVEIARNLYTRLPASGDATLLPLLLSKHVTIKMVPIAQNSSWIELLMRSIPMILLVLTLLVILSSRKGTSSKHIVDDRVTQLGKSRSHRFVPAKESDTSQPKTARHFKRLSQSKPDGETVPIAQLVPPITFADVAGIDEVRAELEEIVQFLRDSERFQRLGAHIPRGALLVGPPGTGKTLLARAVAGEAGVPFFSMSASEFVEMYIGLGAKRVRDLFNEARQASPCVIFLDEIDAVGGKRSLHITPNDEREQTLNQLLVELDGFDPRQAIVVLAATNRLDILDKALLRPGRFDRHIMVPLPDRVGREAILRVHTRPTPLHGQVSLNKLARMTTGMSGADLANLVNEAALGAARRNLDSLTQDCFEDALARVQLGALRPLLMSERDRRIIAVHEGGHALVAHHLSAADVVNRVTILPRGQSLGVTQFIAEEDRYNYSRETLMARVAVGLGGRAAEETSFGPERVTTGAENDFQVVTDLARRMVTRWGMSEKVGVVFTNHSNDAGGAGFNLRRIDASGMPVQARALVADADGHLLLKDNEQPTHQRRFAMTSTAGTSASSPAMATLIDAEVHRILNEGHAMARNILREHHDQLTTLANVLMEREQLNRTEFEALLQEP
jgi:ATP-dependent metalloprotease FtsH